MVGKVRVKKYEQTVKGKGFLYIPKYKLVYARIPKCANTSIKTILSELVKTSVAKNTRTGKNLHPTNDLFWKHCTSEAMFIKPDRYTAIRKNAFTFTFIREPLQRLHSCYKGKVLRTTIPAMKRLGYDNTMSFSDFVELTCTLRIDEMNVHTQPQTFLISDSQGKPPDYIGCLENLKTDWERLNELMKQHGIPLSPQLPHLNSSQAIQTGESELCQLPLRVQHEFELTYGHDIQLHRRLITGQLP